jgi:Meiotically up-regulated gene 113
VDWDDELFGVGEHRLTKANILEEIIRTASANRGIPLGADRFATETGITRKDWYGTHWARWGDAVREAGFQPNKLSVATSTELLLEEYAKFAAKLGHLPTEAELRMKRKSDSNFPSYKTFGKMGNKAELVRQVAEYCRVRSELLDVVTWCEQYLADCPKTANALEVSDSSTIVGYVYLLKHGNRGEYKIGRTNNPLRREGELGIQLPEKCQPVHSIETDDPEGVEAYWHRRFASKRKEGEWFALTSQDVRAFKRWRRIY